MWFAEVAFDSIQLGPVFDVVDRGFAPFPVVELDLEGAWLVGSGHVGSGLGELRETSTMIQCSWSATFLQRANIWTIPGLRPMNDA